MRKFDLQLRALRTKKGLTLTELAEIVLLVFAGVVALIFVDFVLAVDL